MEYQIKIYINKIIADLIFKEINRKQIATVEI